MASRRSNMTSETHSALLASAQRSLLEASLISDIGDRRSMTMNVTDNFSYLPNLTFAEQFQSARRTLSGVSTADESYISRADDFTKMHFQLLLEDDPGWKATEALFGDFLRFLLLFPGQHQVFELLRHYEELCSDQLLILHKVIERGAPGRQKFTRTVEMLRYIEAELGTWRLVRMMYENRLDKRSTPVQDVEEEEVRFMTDLQKWNFLYDVDKHFRELRLAVTWCQQNAADLLNSQENINLPEGKTFPWENTLHVLKAEKEKSRKFVRSMDPDAPTRETGYLEDQDEKDEQRLLTLIYLHVRAGQLDKAVDLCTRWGNPWRGYTLKGALPYYQQPAKESVGNASRDVWKSMAWQFCDNTSLPAIERAIYGALAGHFTSVRSSCGSWDDALWAYTLAASEHTFDKFVRSTIGRGKRPRTELPRTSPMNEEVGEFTLEEILRELSASEDEKIREESKTVFRRLQTFIFLDQPAEAVTYMQEYLGECGDSCPKHLMRLMAHVVLTFKLCSLEIPSSLANGVLEQYVRMLIDDQRTDLVAFYAATLPETLQVFWYAKFLQDVEEKDKRLHYLMLGEKAGLDIATICVTVVNNIRHTFLPLLHPDKTFMDDTDDGIGYHSTLVSTAMLPDLPERDIRLVNSIEWLLFNPALHGEALRQANATARMLLIGRNLSATKRLFGSLPDDIISSASDAWHTISVDMENPQLLSEHHNIIREFLCHQAYLETHDTFQRWFDHVHRRKPQLDDDTGADSVASAIASFHQRVAAELKQKQYQENVALWKQDLQTLADAAVQSAYRVLLYPDDGWMVDLPATSDGPEMEEIMEVERADELVLLRRRCLPLIADMLITVLQGSARFGDAMKVADVMASEETCLYQVFTKDQLKHVSRRLADVSVEAMDNALDCLGHDGNIEHARAS